VLNLDHVQVRPDPAAIWDAVLDTATSGEIRRPVRVKLFPAMFDAPGGDAAERALAVLVQFETGTTLELTSDKPEAEARLPVPLGDLVLKRAVSPYRYRCTVIRRSSRAADADWRTETGDLLVPILPKEG
jgi:hypothetical protein